MEDYLWKLGLDEVGRGAWAGPICAGAVLACEESLEEIERAHGVKITDSKVLKKARREAIASILLKTKNVGVGLGRVEAMEIDTIGLGAANRLAMLRAIRNISMTGRGQIPTPGRILVDGLRSHLNLKKGAETLPWDGIEPEYLTKGETKERVIAAASIVAKVWRDSILAEMAKTHPEFGWEKNVGYGTRQHARTLDIIGPVEGIHRKSFKIERGG
jgi:ribonuclease HII